MTFFLADLLTSTPKPQNAAGAVVAAPAEGEAGAFAEALAAFRAGAVETKTGAAGIVLPGAPATDPKTQTGSPPAATVIGLDQALIPVDPSAIPPRATIAPGDAAPAVAGSALPADAEKALAQLLTGGVKDKGADASSDDTAPDGSQMVAGLVVPGSPAETVAANFKNNADMALKIAGGTPVAPPTLDTPEGAKAAPAAAAADPAALLQEGRASVAGPPPAQPGTAQIPVPEAPVLTQDVLDAMAPRATADTAVNSTPAATAEIPAPAMNASAAPVSPPATTAPTPVPTAAQEIAATPNVVSVQGKIVAQDKPVTEDAPKAANSTPAQTTVSTTPAEDTAPAVPASGANAAAAPVIPAPETALAASPATEAEAADAALAVLTKDKSETKSVTAQARAAPAPAQAPAQASDGTDSAASKPATTSDAPVKTADAKPDAPVDDKAPAANDKPVQSADARTAQPQMPVTDKPVLADAVAKTQQQQAQGLPAAAIPQIATEIATKFKKGATRFEIRLDPPELGRVDVRIDVDTDGRVTSRLMVEKTETLDLLKADQRALERALSDAGFKSDQNSLSFSLRDDRGSGSGQAKFEDMRQMREQTAARLQSEEEPMRLAAGIAYRATMRGPGGFDLRV